jgi:hypothetical protein
LHRLFIYSIFPFFVKLFQSYHKNLVQKWYYEPGNLYALCLSAWIFSIQFRAAVRSCKFPAEAFI